MGPWSRSFLAAVVGNAERPDLEVMDLKIEPGVISARVEGYEVTLTAAPIPQRVWTTVKRYADGIQQLEDALGGRVQSVHLEHLLQEDWDEALIPRTRAIASVCVVDGGSGCDHVAALAYAVADELERTALPLLRWRGISEFESAVADPGDPWRGGHLTPFDMPRSMGRHAVLARLDAKGTQDPGTESLSEALRGVYEVLSRQS